jgi:hypothetical protein
MVFYEKWLPTLLQTPINRSEIMKKTPNMAWPSNTTLKLATRAVQKLVKQMCMVEDRICDEMKHRKKAIMKT